jgi:hypothetical protein
MTAVKRLAVNTRVSGAVREFILNTDGLKRRRCRERWYRHITCAVGSNKYQVQFDNGEVKECPSSILKVERRNASVPPDVPLPSVQEAVSAEQSTLDDAIQKDYHATKRDAKTKISALIGRQVTGDFFLKYLLIIQGKKLIHGSSSRRQWRNLIPSTIIFLQDRNG